MCTILSAPSLTHGGYYLLTMYHRPVTFPT